MVSGILDDYICFAFTRRFSGDTGGPKNNIMDEYVTGDEIL
jgi:hypothetical protein